MVRIGHLLYTKAALRIEEPFAVQGRPDHRHQEEGRQPDACEGQQGDNVDVTHAEHGRMRQQSLLQQSVEDEVKDKQCGGLKARGTDTATLVVTMLQASSNKKISHSMISADMVSAFNIFGASGCRSAEHIAQLLARFD